MTKPYSPVAILTINKLVRALEAIKTFASKNDPDLLGTIEVLASEMLKETEAEVTAIRHGGTVTN